MNAISLTEKHIHDLLSGGETVSWNMYSDKTHQLIIQEHLGPSQQKDAVFNHYRNCYYKY